MGWQDGITITVVEEETDELIVSLVVDSKTDVPFVVGDIIEKRRLQNDSGTRMD